MYELGTDPIGDQVPPTTFITPGSGNTLHRVPDVSADTITAGNEGLYCEVTVATPAGRNSYIEITGVLVVGCDTNTAGSEVKIRLEHNDDGAGWVDTYLTDSLMASTSVGGHNTTGTVPIHYILESPGPGEDHLFRIVVENIGGGTITINDYPGGGAWDYESSLTAIVRPKEW